MPPLFAMQDLALVELADFLEYWSPNSGESSAGEDFPAGVLGAGSRHCRQGLEALEILNEMCLLEGRNMVLFSLRVDVFLVFCNILRYCGERQHLLYERPDNRYL